MLAGFFVSVSARHSQLLNPKEATYRNPSVSESIRSATRTAPPLPHESDHQKRPDPDERSVLMTRVANVILDGAGDAVIVCNRDGIICFWNPGAARIFGFGAAEAVGHSLDIIIPERLRARHWNGFDKVISHGESQYSEGTSFRFQVAGKMARKCRLNLLCSQSKTKGAGYQTLLHLCGMSPRALRK